MLSQTALLMVALVLKVYVTKSSPGGEGETRVELESTTERIVSLEDEVKVKTIESRIRHTVTELENDRVE
jgi:hypothetical protein